MSTPTAPISTAVRSPRSRGEAPRLPRLRGGAGQLVRFAGAGGLGMIAYLALYAGLQVFMSMTISNVIAWTISTLLTNAAQRRYAFGVTNEADRGADSAIALAASLAELAASAIVIAAIAATAATWTAMAAIWAVNLVIGGGRFLVMRWWLCTRHHHSSKPLAI